MLPPTMALAEVEALANHHGLVVEAHTEPDERRAHLRPYVVVRLPDLPIDTTATEVWTPAEPLQLIP